MDNASKALIIAGAVLIAVMLVSVGVMIYQQASGVIGQGQSSMDALEVQMANQIYTQYIGNAKNRNACAQLIDTAAQQISAGAEHTVELKTVKVPSRTAGATTSTESNATVKTADDMRNLARGVRAESNYTYKIEVSKTDTSGYYTELTITGTKG